MASAVKYESEVDLNLLGTELRLGLPGSEKQIPMKNNKRALDEIVDDCGSKNDSSVSDARDGDSEVAPKAKSVSEREGYNGAEHAPTYEDKDGDWMLVEMFHGKCFISSCKRLRIMKGSEARGLGSSV
ncbi:hypothetical protein GIB67_027137 [Kingdonia uniflora]|uniref:Auxin-responsive protein n=1 Tax=Kingdonia uniflora TaxID=39325 RepID=A0A7J7P2H9_9MAGN|nr:hypothetical protein GIB67_027137 [Kingdonia uniflora]